MDYIIFSPVFLILLQGEYSIIISLKHTFHTVCQNMQLITNDEMAINQRAFLFHCLFLPFPARCNIPDIPSQTLEYLTFHLEVVVEDQCFRDL